MLSAAEEIDHSAVSADFNHFVFSTSVRNLGVVFDQEITFSEHLNLRSRACFLQFSKIAGDIPFNFTVHPLP